MTSNPASATGDALDRAFLLLDGVEMTGAALSADEARHCGWILRELVRERGQLIEARELAVWCHAVLDPETHAPTTLSEETLREVNECLADTGRGEFLDKVWLSPGPLARQGEPA